MAAPAARVYRGPSSVVWRRYEQFVDHMMSLIGLYLIFLLFALDVAQCFHFGNAFARVSRGNPAPRLMVTQGDDVDNIGDMTVVELKNVLRSMNLPVSGVKSALQARIEEAAASKTAFAYGDRDSTSGRISEEGGDILKKVKIADHSRLKPKPKDAENDDALSAEEGGGKDLWFDDSVFDTAENASKGSERRRNAMREMSRKSMLEGRYGRVSGSVSDGNLTPAFSRGESVEATVLGFGPLGASVVVHKKDGGVDTSSVNENDDDDDNVAGLTVEAEARGLILQQEVTFWSAVNGGQPDIGQTLTAYVLSIREDGKLDITLRPVGYDKVLQGSERVLEKIQEASSGLKSGDNRIPGGAGGGFFPLGPKSSPEEVWKILPGMSKREFKSSVGKIVNEGKVEIVEEGRGLRYIPEGARVETPKAPYSGKSPRGWRAPEGCTIFVANIPFTMDHIELAGVVESHIGFGKVAAVKVSVDPATGKARGFAHLEFFAKEDTDKALIDLKGIRANGRELRFELPYGVRDGSGGGDGVEREQGRRSARERDWGDSSQYGRRTLDGTRVRGVTGQDNNNNRDLNKEGGGAWTTVYAGNLAYAVSEESLKHTIEDSVGEGGVGIVAAVRIAVDRDDPNRKRGFGYVDFYDEKSARMVCDKLGGMLIMGRPVQLDYEGPKKRAKFDDDANKTFIPGKNNELNVRKKRFNPRGGGGGYRGSGGGGGGGRR